ncbi:Ras-GEF domain-containing protein [Entamoeba marina]
MSLFSFHNRNSIRSTTQSLALTTHSDPRGGNGRSSYRKKRDSNAFHRLGSSDDIPPKVFELCDHVLGHLEDYQQLHDLLKEEMITFSFQLELAERIGGFSDDWDVSLCRMYVNKLPKSYITLLQKLVKIAIGVTSGSKVYSQIACFLLPIQFIQSPQLSISMLDVMTQHYFNVFDSPTFDPIYQLEENSIRPSLFAASPKTLITLLLLSQQPEPDYPHRLAIYLSVSLSPNDICVSLKSTLDGEQLDKRATLSVNALLNHLLSINNDLPLAKYLSDYLDIPSINKQEIEPRFTGRITPHDKSTITNAEILKSKRGDLLDVKSKIMAEQLMLLDSLLLKEINTLGRWVSYSIKTADGTKATNVMKYFIKIASICLRRNSFNISYALYTGISHFSLGDTLSKIPHSSNKKYEELQRVFNFSKNYTVYRNIFTLAHSPKIPILPLWLGDIIHAHTAFSSNTNENGLLRMDALKIIANVMLNISHAQRVSFTTEDFIVEELFNALLTKYDF